MLKNIEKYEKMWKNVKKGEMLKNVKNVKKCEKILKNV